MKCPLFVLVKPLFVLAKTGDFSERVLIDTNCLKQECAWWVETQDMCAIKQLSLSLGFISLDTTQLLERLRKK